MKIDIYTHIMGEKFRKAFDKRIGPATMLSTSRASEAGMQQRNSIEKRLEVISKFDGMVHVLTPTGHTLEKYTSPQDASYLAQVYNDELAEMVEKHPEFIAFVACLPLNDIEACLKETERAVTQLGARGISVHTPINGRPLDMPELLPLYEMMLHYDLPIWIHPTRYVSQPDYDGEEESKYKIFHAFGWPYETSVAMCRLVCSGVLARFPNLKLITHHAGAMIPFLSGRLHMLQCPYELAGDNSGNEKEYKAGEDYFRLFYNDTAIYGNAAGLMCAYDFFGPDRLLFGSDCPYGPGMGEEYTRLAIEAINDMDIPAKDREKIFSGNARKLLNL